MWSASTDPVVLSFIIFSSRLSSGLEIILENTAQYQVDRGFKNLMLS